MLDLEMKGLNRQILRPVKSAESLIMLQKREQAACQQELNGGSTSRPISGDSDDLAPLETVTKAVGSIGRRRGGSHKGHERSNSHDSYFERAKREAEAAEAAAKADSSLDLSDLQVNFDLEETEMNIFTEDMLSNSLGSDISKSPLEDNKQQSQQPQQVELRNLAPKKSPRMSTESNEGGEDSPKSRSRMSFREKLKRFTSPTPSRVRRDSEEGGSDGEIIKTHPDQVRRPSSSIRDKLVCALSPESLRRRHTTTIEASPATSSEREIQTTGDTSPKKKKSAFSPGTSPSANLVKRSKIEEEQSRQVPHSDVVTINHSDVATINQNDVAEIVVAVATNDVATIPLSPSMKFIDSSMHESTDSTAARLLTTGESGGKHDNSHRFSTTSSTDDEGVLLDQLVVAQVHHNPILESQHEEEEDQESDDLDAKILHNVPIETDSTSFNQVALMQKKLSVTSQLSGEQTPSEFSVSFAGATVSENESFSILSVDEDHMMIPICQEIDSIYPVVQQPSQHIVPEMEQENLQTVGGGNVKELFDRLDDEVIEGVEAMEVDEYKFVESKLLQSLESVEHMEVDETNTNKNRFDYRPLTTKESSADSSISDENDRSCKRRSESSDSAASSSASDPSDVPTAVKLDNVDEDRLPTHVASTVFYTKQTSRFTLQVNEDNSKQDIQKPVQLLPSAHPCKSPREEGEPQAAAKQDLTFRTYGPKPYTKKETFQPAVQFEMETEDCIVDIKRSHGGLRSRFPQSISEVEKPQQDFLATSRNDNSHNKFKQDNSFVNKSRQEENLFIEKSTLDNSFIDKSKSDALVLDKSKPDTLLFDKSHADKFKPDTLVLDKSKPDTLLFDKSHEDIMEDENEAEAKSFSLPHIQASEMEVDGRKSAQGIPEIEKKLSFAEPNLTKVPSDGVIAKGKKLSTFSLQSAEEAKQAALVAAEELPLQRRSSVHNVPYVDVNDPATRERMERYKEERRSMLRAKYRVEDYREKPPSGKSSETKKPGEETSPIRKMSESSEKQSPDLSRYRKVSTTSNDKTTTDDKVDRKVSMATSNDKSHATADDKGDRKVSMATSNDKSHATADDKVDRKVSMTTSNDKSHATADDKGDRKASMTTSNDKSQLTTAATVPDKVKPVDPSELTPSTGLRKLPMEKSPVNTKSAASYLVDNFTKQVDTVETPMRKWTSTSRTSLTSFENKKVSVSIIEPEVTLRKVTTATPTTTVLPVQKIATPIISPASPATLPFNQENVYTAKTTVLQRQKLNSRSSLPTGGLVEDDVNVRERAAIFNSAAAHRANQAELRTKFVSLTPPSKESKNSNRKIGGPGSPSKIKNIAAMFEQKT